MAATVATTVVATATSRLFRRAARIAGLVADLKYQSRVKPSQDAERRLALKDRATRTRIGA